MSDVDHKLHREMKAVAALKESLKEFDDDELLHDSIEGETNLFELIDKLLAGMDEDRTLILGVEARAAELDERKNRLKHRIERRRAMVEQAMVLAEAKSLERPTMTLSLRNTPPKLHVEDEALIPSDFWKSQAPTLDKKKLTGTLKDGDKVPGASLTNGGVSLQVRTK